MKTVPQFKAQLALLGYDPRKVDGKRVTIVSSKSEKSRVAPL